MNKIFYREVACILAPGTDFVSISTNNSPGFVEFDFFKIWNFYKEHRKDIKFLCLLHTHPFGLNRKSSIDENSLFGWVQAFNPLKINYSIIQPKLEIIYLADKPNEAIEITSSDTITDTLIYLSYKEQNPTSEELKFSEELCQTAIHMEW